jgi:hypothetical protein
MIIYREEKKRAMEKAFLEFQRRQAQEMVEARQREKEEALRLRRLAENAAQEAKVKRIKK